MIDRKKLESQNPYIFNEIFINNYYRAEKSEIENSVVIDIGANIGMFSLYCLDLGASNIYSVEAQPTIYQTLLENIKDYKNIVPVNRAVYSKSGSIVNIPNNSGESKITNSGTHSSDDVITITLEDLLDTNNIQRTDLILKIDCEGSEFDILEPIDKDVIRRFKIIYMELHGNTNINVDYQDVSIVENKLTNCGFTRVLNMPMLMFYYDQSIPPTPLGIYQQKWIRV